MYKELFEAIATAIREQWRGGRSYGQLAIELGISQRSAGQIVQGKRGVGWKTFWLVRKANPPWLRDILSGMTGHSGGGNGKGPQGPPDK